VLVAFARAVHLRSGLGRNAYVQPFFLIYVSIANEPFSDPDLVELLNVSRCNNELSGITGMLLYKDRRFLQILEGDEHAVRTTYGRILRDPRHRDAVTLLEGEKSEREFHEWSMAFKHLDAEAVRATPGFSPFLETKLAPAEFAADPSRAQQLLRIFRRM
jgi:hypothetical protein